MPLPPMNKLLTLAGSLCLSNGFILLVAPARFAALRKMDRMPDRYNQTLDSLKDHVKTGRSLGAISVLLGVALLLMAVQQTDPES